MKRCTFVSCVGVAALLLAGGVATAQDEAQPEDPLGDIVADMSVVVKDLTKQQTGKPTQGTQKLIVRKLDDLIERLEKECAACRGSGASSSNPTRPLDDSRIIGGPGGIGDLHAPRAGGKKWGELPAHQREKILQSQTEGFPAHYQKILERYFKRLAEEKPTAEPETGAKPADSKTDAPTPAANGTQR